MGADLVQAAPPVAAKDATPAPGMHAAADSWLASVSTITVYNDSMRTATPLTPAQSRVLQFIEAFIARERMPPTQAEITAAMGFASRTATRDHLNALERKGVLTQQPGAARGIRLQQPPEEKVGLPLIGRVAAGVPILAVEHVEDHYQVEASLFQPRADYLLRVRGESMRDAGILDGDLLAVHRSPQAREGQIVVARVGDEVTVKRFRRRGDAIELQAENPDFSPLVIAPGTADFAIEGLMVGLIRPSPEA